MSPKAYALILCAVGASVFAAIAAINVIVDPQGVFQTGLFSIQHPNQRYQRFSAYEGAQDRYDGVLFGSSRAQMIPRGELAANLGGQFADFAVPAGLLDDHLPVLEYMLRPTATPRPRLRTIFLMIDIDNFGNPPVTNRFHNTWLAPTLTGESVIHWWWRHLTALQFDRWRAVLKETRMAREAALREKQAEEVLVNSGRAAVPPPPPLLNSANIPLPQAAQEAAATSASLERITSRLDFGRQLQLLERMAALCREHGTTLVVAISPMHPDIESRLDPHDMAQAVQTLTRIVPVWDFSGTSAIVSRAELWHEDKLHFAPEIGWMMMRKMFSGTMPPGWLEFGRLRQQANN